MKCLVTGAAGFIGSHLCEKLVELGHDVVGMDDLSAGKMANIQHIQGMNFCKVGVLDKYFMATLFEKYEPEVVFNQMASKKTVCLKDPKKDCDVNAKGTLALLELCKEHGVKKFIHASTGSVYGEHDEVLTENTYRDPRSFYGISKLAGENYVKLYRNEFDCTILRYFHVYGPRQDNTEVGGVVSIFINNIINNLPVTVFGTGEQKRLFTYVKDVVAANIAAMDYKDGTFNCASDEPIALLDMLKEVYGIINKSPQPPEFKMWQPGDIINFEIDNSLIKEELGINFTKFKMGIEKTIWDALN